MKSGETSTGTHVKTGAACFPHRVSSSNTVQLRMLYAESRQRCFTPYLWWSEQPYGRMLRVRASQP
eukprot:3055261-Pyramimonas_sp.AAC.2